MKQQVLSRIQNGGYTLGELGHFYSRSKEVRLWVGSSVVMDKRVNGKWVLQARLPFEMFLKVWDDVYQEGGVNGQST